MASENESMDPAWNNPEGFENPTEENESRIVSFLVRHGFKMFMAALFLLLGFFIWRSLNMMDLSVQAFDQIQPGMTEAEVVQTLGGNANSMPPRHWPPSLAKPEDAAWRAWEDEKTLVLIGFVEGKVRYKHRL